MTEASAGRARSADGPGKLTAHAQTRNTWAIGHTVSSAQEEPAAARPDDQVGMDGTKDTAAQPHESSNLPVAEYIVPRVSVFVEKNEIWIVMINIIDCEVCIAICLHIVPDELCKLRKLVQPVK